MPAAPNAVLTSLADPTRRAIFERLIRDGEPLRAGEIVLTGTLAGAIPLHAGETMTAEFSGIGPEPMVVSISA